MACEIAVSLVCGTYNRLPTLKRMLDSVHNNLRGQLSYEIIIVDNGSTDGTAEWLAKQTDLEYIQMGSPVGAVKAFTEGAYHAEGRYVLLATDDIQFPVDSILAAWAHLERTPNAGAVAFKHNKRREKFSADHIEALDTRGNKIPQGVPYPQIALVRRWLGDALGWWGGRHPVMKDAFTYAGDNFLGAGIWESGYTVEVTDLAVNVEDVIEDEPRRMNRANHRQDAALYFSIYPEIVVNNQPINKRPHEEELRVLYSVHYNPQIAHHRANKQTRLNAFRQFGYVYEYDYNGRHDKGGIVHEELARIAGWLQPHVIFTQVHNIGRGMTPLTAQALRYAAPNAVFVNWNGDYWPKNVEAPDTQQYLHYCDLMLTGNRVIVDILCKVNICTAYHPESFEDVIADISMPAHEVVYAGNAYSDRQRELGRFLKALPYDVGLYGSWGDIPADGYTLYQHDKSQGLYTNAKIAISHQHFDDAEAYVSNRMWEILCCGGAVCMQEYSRGLDEATGLRAGVHYVEYTSLADLREKIDYYLQHEDEARAIAQTARDYVRKEHSFLRRIEDLLLRLIPEYVARREEVLA